MSNKGWTAIYHRIWPITPPFTVVLTEGAVCALQLVRDCGGAGEAPSPRTISILSWPRLAWPRAGGTFVQQTGFGTLRWSSLLQNAPQLMEWDTTVTTWPSKAPLKSPAVLPCVTYGSKSIFIFSTPEALKYVPLRNVLFFQGWTFYCTIHQLLSQP